MRRRGRWIVPLVAGFLAWHVTPAFTAGNGVEAPAAGWGSGAVSGYEVSDVRFSLDAIDPAAVDAVTFRLDASAATVRVKLAPDAEVGYACTETAELSWSCPTTNPPASVADARALTVIATS